MTAALGRRSPFAALAALATALIVAALLYMPAAQAQQYNKRGYCHGTGS